jgi:Ca-activated chloride channel family protein
LPDFAGIDNEKYIFKKPDITGRIMQLFRFADPEYLYLLLLLPFLALLWILNEYRRRRALRRLGNIEIIKKLIPELSEIRPVLKFIFLMFALSLAIIMLARPQFGSKLEEVKRQGVEVILALDVSNSMLAEDIQPNRLERAKQAISKLVENLKNDKIGLIVFAGDAYTQIPVTTDYISAKMFLSSIGPEMVPKQGTAIGSAIDLGIRSFSQGTGRSKAMVIITDGENHEDDPVSKAREAAAAGIVIHTIGIGSTEGVPISLDENGKKDFMKDSEGNTVISKLDENILKEIAMTANGIYVRASNSNIRLEEVYKEITKLKKQELEGKMFTEYNDQFQIFAGAVLLLLLIEFMIMERKNRRLSNLRIFKLKV